MPELEFNDHHVGAGFDRDVCSGEHPAVAGPCPYFVPAGEELPAEMQGGVTGTVAELIDSEQCGACRCPLSSLGLFSAPPTEEKGCPRVAEHREHG